VKWGKAGGERVCKRRQSASNILDLKGCGTETHHPSLPMFLNIIIATGTSNNVLHIIRRAREEGNA
jgi:hypothetical protein